MNPDNSENSPNVIKILFARLRFVAVFLVAAVLVGYWDDIRNHIDKWTRPTAAQVATESNTEYTCPMHPNIVRDRPGNCPICGMPLEQREKGKPTTLPADVMARVQISPQRIQLANIQTSTVGYRKLAREIHAVGVLDYNETNVAQLSSRISGRADELFVQFSGQQVKRGQPLYSLYSPEVYTAQREYLLSRKRVNDLPTDASSEAKADATAVYNASLQKLVLWGIGREQFEKMEKEFDKTGVVPTHLVVSSPIAGIVIKKDIFEGSYVQAGQSPYTIADLGSLWLKAKIYEQDVPLVKVGQAVEVNVEAFSGRQFQGVVTFMGYQLDTQTRTLDARIDVANKDLQLRPGMFADATIKVGIVSKNTPSSLPSAKVKESEVIFAEALQPYLQVQALLAQDKMEGAADMLHRMLDKLQPLAADTAIAPAFQRLEAAVHGTMKQDIKGIRQNFKTISTAMIEIGKIAKLPANAEAVKVFHCPMAKADWLQKAGETANPYYGAEMLTCGEAVESMPKAELKVPATHPAGANGEVLAIPRSALIETGRKKGSKIVYVESSAGVFDMRAVDVGLPAGEWYPVVAGLEEGDRVVTVGAFLVDSENRLHPMH